MLLLFAFKHLNIAWNLSFVLRNCILFSTSIIEVVFQTSTTLHNMLITSYESKLNIMQNSNHEASTETLIRRLSKINSTFLLLTQVIKILIKFSFSVTEFHAILLNIRLSYKNVLENLWNVYFCIHTYRCLDTLTTRHAQYRLVYLIDIFVNNYWIWK